jgi:hypothetical protein
VQIKHFLNRSESRALDLLESVFGGTLWAVYAKTRVADVIEPSPDERPMLPEGNMLEYGHFDFVIINRSAAMPVFVIEFDGPSHNDPVQRRRDATKSLLCERAGLPLLRVTADDIAPREQTTMLEWLVERFVRVQDDERRLARSGPHEPALTEFARLQEHPFPPVKKVIGRLHRSWHIVCAEWYAWGGPAAALAPVDDAPLLVVPDPFYLDSLGLLHEFELDGPRWKDFLDTGVASLLVTRPNGEIAYRAQARVNLDDRADADLLVLDDLIGSNMLEMQASLAEYLALREIERWALRELVEIAA